MEFDDTSASAGEAEAETLAEPAGTGQSEPFGRVEEAIRPPKGGIAKPARAARRGSPQLALQLLDPLRQLGRTAWCRDVGVGPRTAGETDGVVWHPWQEGEDEPRVGQRRKMPAFCLAELRPIDPSLGGRLGQRGLSVGRR